MSNAFLISHFSLLISDGVRFGGLAQLARAPALQAGGQRFESVILHYALLEREFFDILTQTRL